MGVGVRVVVPFGKRREVGIVVGVDTRSSVAPARLRWVQRVLDTEPAVTTDLLELTRWMADHYACAWGEALAACLPAGLRREGERRKVRVVSVAAGVGETELAQLERRYSKQHRLLRTLMELDGPVPLRQILPRLGLGESPARSLAAKGMCILEWEEESDSDSDQVESDRRRPDELTAQQQTALEGLQGSLASGGGCFLLKGVTGSGKTEVYLRLIEAALAQGRGAIVVVPEIALTPQTESWFRSRFDGVVILHSRISDAQRARAWLAARHGRARVVVGARSALFAPVQELGVVVVDEEHEPSFKQGTAPRYHAREVAVKRSELVGAVCVLGSATPSLESWRRAKEGRYELLRLDRRVHGKDLPAVQVIDMRVERPVGGAGGTFARPMATALRETLARGEQAILFQNRRGFAPVLWCHVCRETLRCHQCDVGLTLHRRHGRLVCHACCEERAVPKLCPGCSRGGLRPLGIGSERVEDALHGLLPDARVARMDSDTMLRPEDYERTLSAFGAGEFDVLVGTQMIAKGLDFPRVTLVGVISADSSLHLPDFRASERTFQLVSQVAGRAGRGQLPGRILVQTWTPEHPAIQRAVAHDYEGFADGEERLRAELGYPPFGELVRVLAEDECEQKARAAVERAAERLKAGVSEGDIRVLGPAPAPLAQVRGRHRWHLLIKGPTGAAGLERARELMAEEAGLRGGTRLVVDVDPTSML